LGVFGTFLVEARQFLQIFSFFFFPLYFVFVSCIMC